MSRSLDRAITFAIFRIITRFRRTMPGGLSRATCMRYLMRFTTDGYRGPDYNKPWPPPDDTMKYKQKINSDTLPNLLYFGDVPVEHYLHGSTLLYRLLSTYPKEKLIIIEGSGASIPDRRISGVPYSQCKQ